MLIDLSLDPLYQILQSPVKLLKDKLKKNKKIYSTGVFSKTQEIFDPLLSELNNYKSQISYKRATEGSRASESLKKYIIEQQKNLRCVRLQRLSPLPQQNKQLFLQIEQNSNKVIHIPQINQMFKNQTMQILVHQNRDLRERITKRIGKLDQKITDLRGLSQNKDRKSKLKEEISLVNNVENQEEIDDIIQKNLKKSHDLRSKLYQNMREKQTKVQTAKGIDISFLSNTLEIPKVKKMMQGIKFYPYKNGDKQLELTSASILLFELHKLGQDQERKESQLTGLLKNSYKNRDTILAEKVAFYQNEDIDLSVPSQFRLRKIMNQKLNRRLEKSKQQVNMFILFLEKAKNYHIVLNQTLLSIFQEVRSVLLSGKVMKASDLLQIVATKNQQQLKGDLNTQILSHLYKIMI